MEALTTDGLGVLAPTPQRSVTYSRTDHDTSHNATQHHVIHMLSWTAQTMFSTVGENEQWFANFGPSPMDVCYSPVFNYLEPDFKCIYTNDKSQYNMSDVIMFRGRRLNNTPLPNHRLPNQSWLFFDFEPPYKIWERTNLTRYNGVFNLTSTYSKDSDIPYTYYLSKQCIRNNTKYAELAGKDYTIKKMRRTPIGWMVSMCKTQSKREDYVGELSRHIGVDIYGQCGPFECGTNNLSTWKVDNCDQLLFHNNNSYKFYLGFENSLCEDNITEKLWRMVKLDVVPIVMGAVNYANILPKGSYIDVRDFRSPQALATYLKFLDRNKDVYNQYLRNKNSLYCFNTVQYLPKQCHLCKGLHELRAKSGRVVHDLASFISNRQCSQLKHFLKNHHTMFSFPEHIYKS